MSTRTDDARLAPDDHQDLTDSTRDDVGASAPGGVTAGPGRHGSRRRRWALPGVLAVIGVLHTVNISGWPVFSSDDEGTYYAQAWATLNKGELAHYTYWYDHPPLGWLQLAPFLEPLEWLAGGVPAVIGGRLVMVLATLVSAALLYRLAQNLDLRPGLALAVPLLWALSPLVVFEGRQVFLDNLQLPWLIGSLVLATDRAHRLPMHLASGACFGVAVLTKETALLAAPAVVLALWQYAYRPTRAFSLVGWFSATSLVGLGYPLFAVLKGELLSGGGHVSLASALDWQLFSRAGTGFLFSADSAANQTLRDWLTLDPLLLTAGLAAAVLAVAVRRLRPVSVLVLVYAASMLRPSGYLPQMLVIVVLPFAALLVVGVLDAALNTVQRLPGRWEPAGRLAVTGVVLTGVLALAGSWPAGLRTALTENSNAPYEQAISYVTDTLPRDTVVVTDDIAWNDLVRAGWGSEGFDGAVWYYKLDRDVESRAALPGGWRDVDYLLVGRPMAVLLDDAVTEQTDPNVMAAYRNSTIVQQWGPPGTRVELRAVDAAGAR